MEVSAAARHIYIYVFRLLKVKVTRPGLATMLRAGRSGDRIPVGARFSTPVRTGPGAHPASYTICTGSFPRVKLPGRGADHPPLSSTEVKKE